LKSDCKNQPETACQKRTFFALEQQEQQTRNCGDRQNEQESYWVLKWIFHKAIVSKPTAASQAHCRAIFSPEPIFALSPIYLNHPIGILEIGFKSRGCRGFQRISDSLFKVRNKLWCNAADGTQHCLESFLLLLSNANGRVASAKIHYDVHQLIKVVCKWWNFELPPAVGNGLNRSSNRGRHLLVIHFPK
jgi:hypothetical protein